MTLPATVNTSPFCGSCGGDYVAAANLNNDGFCDACGAFLAAYNPDLASPPVVATAASLGVSFAWTENAGSDTTNFRSRINGGVYTTLLDQTTPNVVSALEGDTVEGQVQSVTNGVLGAWGVSDSAVALA